MQFDPAEPTPLAYYQWANYSQPTQLPPSPDSLDYLPPGFYYHGLLKTIFWYMHDTETYLDDSGNPIGESEAGPSNQPMPTLVPPPDMSLRYPGSLRTFKSYPNLKEVVVNSSEFQKPSLRHIISQPRMVAKHSRCLRQFSKEQKQLQKEIESSTFSAEEYHQILQERAEDVRHPGHDILGKLKMRDRSGKTVVPSVLIREVGMAVCYHAVHRDDETISDAVAILREMPNKMRDELVRYVGKVLLTSGGNSVDLFKGAAYDDIMRSILGITAIDWEGPGVRDHVQKFKPKWPPWLRKWEIRKFCGIMWYAMKIVEKRIHPFAETIPDYAIRMGGQRTTVPNDITIISPYFSEGKDVREQLHGYINQLFDPFFWKSLGPLMWVVTPMRLVSSDLSREEQIAVQVDDLYCPKIVLIEVGQSQFAIYRFFNEKEGQQYEQFKASIGRLGTYKPSKLKEDDLVEFCRMGKTMTDSEENDVRFKANRLAGRIGNGRLSGEVRFMFACMEVGIEMAYTTRNGAWLAVAGVVDGVLKTEYPDIQEKSMPKKPDLKEEEEVAVVPVDDEKQKKDAALQRLTKGVWSYYGFRVLDVKYEKEPKMVEFLDQIVPPSGRKWNSFDLPPTWQTGHQQFPWEAGYEKYIHRAHNLRVAVMYTNTKTRVIPPLWQEVLLRKVEKDRNTVSECLYGLQGGEFGRSVKDLGDKLKRKESNWYGVSGPKRTVFGMLSWNLLLRGRKTVPVMNRMRIKEIRCLGFEGEKMWDKAWNEGLAKRVFE
ncbi:hypothetical protein TWF730_006327 [Orbilia blumenaviensis]|uniref:Uncharacterized protein n=1 Tax=Orbilia blumenaviensis TaxID=1796055 RepID=A0AAV9VK88_9PEZI